MAPYPPSNPLPQDMRSYAVLIVDMWDQHWCTTATKRVRELARRVNEFVYEARKRHALIIHAPSDSMDWYEGGGARDRAKNSPKQNLPPSIKDMIEEMHKKDPKDLNVPIVLGRHDGCPDDPSCSVWTGGLRPGMGEGNYFHGEINQIISIYQENDAVSDKMEEIYSLLKNEKRRNVLILGVHLNLCVLSTRSFSLNKLAALRDLGELDAVHLVRDLTDTMYHPAELPRIHDHYVATDVVAQYIEQTHERPSRPDGALPLALFSSDLLGGSYFRFADDKRPVHPEWSKVKLKYHGSVEGWLRAKRGTDKVFDISLVQNKDDHGTTWQLEMCGPSLYYFVMSEKADKEGEPDKLFYLDGDAKGGRGSGWSIKMSSTKLAAGGGPSSADERRVAAWWVAPPGQWVLATGGVPAHFEPAIGVPANGFYLRCCDKGGTNYFLDGGGVLTMRDAAKGYWTIETVAT